MRQFTLALRALRDTPFVSAVAVLSLALGIGANAAIFSLVEQVILRPLAVPEASRLVNLGAPGPKPGGNSCNDAGPCEEVFSYAMFRDLEREQTAFTGLAAHRAFDANVAFEGHTLNGVGMLVSGAYFPVLGLRPALGRLLTPDDDRARGGHFVAVLSHAYWTTVLGADPGVVGRAVVVNGNPMTVVGVAAPGFEGTTLGQRPRVFVPLSMAAQMLSSRRILDDRRNYWLYLFGRLKPGVTLDGAQRRLDAVYRPILAEVEAPLQEGMSPRTLAQFRSRSVTVAPGARGQSSIHREARTPLAMLFGITAIVLLIACANVANLLLARGARRETEMAVRLALGAGRRRLVLQLLAEATLLAVLGGAVGLVVAQWTLHGIGGLLKPEALEILQLTLDWQVVGFAAAVALATGVGFGLVPALQSTRSDIIGAIRAGAGHLTGGSRTAARLRNALATAQIALSMALLVSAGLFVKSLRNVSREALGLDVERLVTFSLAPSLNGYTAVQSRALLDRVHEALAATPGVTGVAESSVPLLAGDNRGSGVAVEGFTHAPDTPADASYSEVSPGFFRAVGVPLRAGREFTDADGPGRPRVAIVNETFARRFGLGANAVGRRMATDERGALEVEIVGVVPDLKYAQVRDAIPPVYYLPVRQDSTGGGVTFYARTSVGTDPVLRAIPGLVKRLDPTLPVVGLKSMPQQVRDNTFVDRMIGTLAASFATLATLLAAIGLYGVLAYTVAQRTREIGVRMALGADAGRVRALVLRQVGRMLAVGGAVGLLVALALGRAASSLLFGLEGSDPATFAIAITVLTLVALAAGWLPARGAARVDPMVALRQD